MSTSGLLLLVILSIGVSRLFVFATNTADVRLRDLNQELANLKEQFVEDINKILYDRLREALKDGMNYPLVALSAHMAQIHATLYAFQRRGLFVAQEIIQNYFIDRSKRLSPIFLNNQFLVDMIVQRCIEHSIQDGFYEIEQSRKLLYLLLRRYEDAPGVLELARDYLQNIMIMSVKEEFVKTDFKESFREYKQQVSTTVSKRFASATLKALDDMIDDAWDSLNEDNLLRKYVDPKLLDNIQAAKRKTVGKIDEIDPALLEPIKMSTVLLYEEKVVDELKGLALSRRDLDLKQAELDEQFTNKVRDIFYEPQLKAEVDENYPLMDISIRITECEGLMHVDEQRMLNIINQIIDQCTIAFGPTAEFNTDPIDIIVQHLIKYSLENGLVAIEDRRKEIYLLLQSYDRRMAVKELAHKLAQSIHNRKVRILDAEMYIRDLWREYQVEVADELSQEQIASVMNTVDEIVRTAIELWRKESEVGQSSLLELYLEPRMLMDLDSAKREATGNIGQVDPDRTRSVSIADVMVYDDKLKQELSVKRGLDTYLSEIDIKINDLEGRFYRAIAEIFYNVQGDARQRGDYHLMTLSARMAESETAMHVYERRMLSTLKCIINQYSKAFKKIIAVSNSPIDLIAHRLMKYDLEQAFTAYEDQIKKIYLLTKENEDSPGVKEVAKKYFTLTKIREQRINKNDELIAIYTKKVTHSISSNKLAFALDAIESIIKSAVSSWHRLTRDADKTGQLEVYIDPKLLKDIESAKLKAGGEIDGLDSARIGSVDMSEVRRYRRQLLNSN